MQLHSVELAIKVRGRPITEYPHDGKVFIEGRENSEYEIEIRNNNNFRIEAIVSVDGLSVTDGKAAGEHSSGYLIDRHKSVSIPGWRLDAGNVAKFAFAGKKGSYATQMTGDARNNGVIGALVFPEKPQPWRPSIECSASPLRGMTPQQWNTAAPTHYYGSDSSTYTASAALRGMMGMAKSAAAPQSVNLAASGAPEMFDLVQQNMGTAFGDQTAFQTTTVSFERGALLATLLLYYDDKRGLRKRGVVMDRKPKQQEPQAFPGMGCVPPPGWNSGT